MGGLSPYSLAEALNRAKNALLKMRFLATSREIPRQNQAGRCRCFTHPVTDFKILSHFSREIRGINRNVENFYKPPVKRRPLRESSENSPGIVERPAIWLKKCQKMKSIVFIVKS